MINSVNEQRNAFNSNGGTTSASMVGGWDEDVLFHSKSKCAA